MMQRCLVILGMHRNGTSAFSGVFNILGLNLGIHLMSPAQDNPKGFFENDNIVHLNEKILKSLNSSWDDLFFLPENWWDDENIKTFRKEAIKIIETEFKDEVFCIKDPRISKLLPFWNGIFEELNIKPHFVITIRNPLEVAYSLEKRNGFSIEKSMLLWLSYMLDAEYFSRDCPRIFLSFDDLLKEPEGVIKSTSHLFNIDFPHAYADIKDEIGQFLDPSLKHYRSIVEGRAEILDLIFEYYRILAGLNREGTISEADLSRIDDIRNNFTKLHKYFYNADLTSGRNTFISNLKASYELMIKEKETKVKDIETSLTTIYNTRSWKLIQRYYCLRDKILPYGTRKRQLFESILKMPFLLKNLFKKDLLTLENTRKSFLYIRLYGISGYLYKVANKIAKNKDYHINKYFLKVLKRKYHKELFKREHPVDILIPINNPCKLTAQCINSVLGNSENCRLILVSDGISDSGIEDFLSNLEINTDKKIEIVKLQNKEQLGFTKSINESLKHIKNHFVLLSPTTVVPQGWLDKLFAPIFKDEDFIGSVSPFSNTGSTGYPAKLFENHMSFKTLNVETINNYFEQYGSDETVDVPTGSGFCMAFNRKAVESIGLFDEENFRGSDCGDYDWSMRANKAGFKNVVITNLFIFHENCVSSQPYDKDKAMMNAFKKLEDKHPEYNTIMQDFMNKDPLKDVRETLEIFVDYHTKGDKKLYAFIEHVGGGSEYYVTSLTEQLHKKGIMTMRFKYDFNGKKFIVVYNGNSLTREFALDCDDVEKQFKDIFSFFKFDYIFVNQMVSWPNVIYFVDNIKDLNISYIVFIHDYFYVCPSWNLINNKGRFCNVPELNTCKNCLPNNKFSNHNLYYKTLFDIYQWRKSMNNFLKNAKYLICPSKSVRDYLLTVYRDLQNIVVIEHFETDLSFDAKKRKLAEDELVIGILGDIGYHKGDKILKELVYRLKRDGLPVKIVVIGYIRSFPAPYKSEDGKLFIHGKYSRPDLPELLERYNVSAILMPSICPETFSYTISEAMMLRYPIISFNIGAQAERIKNYNCGIIVEDISVEGIITAFKELLSNPGLIETFSYNASRFKPQTGQEYIERLIRLLD